VEVVLRLMNRINEMEEQIQQMSAEIDRLRARQRRHALSEGKQAQEQ